MGIIYLTFKAKNVPPSCYSKAVETKKYMISYDLKVPGQDYQTLYDELKNIDAKRVLASQWVFNRANTTASGLRDYFRSFLDSNDRLLIVEINGTGWAGWNLISKINQM